jgi:hypothetical protein
MKSISYENIYNNKNNNNNDYFNYTTYISNNHIHFLLHLINKKRYIGNITYKIIHKCKIIDISFENIITLNTNDDYDKFTEIEIKKEYIFSSIEINFYLWQLTILIYYFLQNNIDFSFSNLCIYKEYLDSGGGYRIDYLILNGDKNIEHKKINNYYLNKLKSKK